MAIVAVDIFVRMEVMSAGAAPYHAVEVSPPTAGWPVPESTGGPARLLNYSPATGVVQDLTHSLLYFEDISPRTFDAVVEGIRTSATSTDLSMEVGVSSTDDVIRIYEVELDLVSDVGAREKYRPLALSVHPTFAEAVGNGWISIVGDPPQLGDDSAATYLQVTGTAYAIALVKGVATSAVRQYPRDDTLGLGTTNRLYPPPRSGRMFGGQP